MEQELADRLNRLEELINAAAYKAELARAEAANKGHLLFKIFAAIMLISIAYATKACK